MLQQHFVMLLHVAILSCCIGTYVYASIRARACAHVNRQREEGKGGDSHMPHICTNFLFTYSFFFFLNICDILESMPLHQLFVYLALCNIYRK